MKSSRLLAYFWGALAVLTLQNCQDHRLSPVVPGSPTTRLRVQSLSQDMPGNASKITNFTYDAQGRLNSLLAYESPDSTVASVERSSYQYDAQNRLVLHQYQLITRPTSVIGPIAQKQQFSYNSAGQVAEVRFSYFGNPAAGQTIVDLATLNDPNTLLTIGYPRYNAANQLVGLRKVSYFQGQATTLESANEYGYTGNNLTDAKTVTTSNQGSIPYTRTEQNSLTYDNKINPFYGVYVIPKYFGGISETFQNLNTLSPSNILTLGGLTYTYEYNASNLPTVRYTTYNNRLVETLRFRYESY